MLDIQNSPEKLQLHYSHWHLRQLLTLLDLKFLKLCEAPWELKILPWQSKPKLVLYSYQSHMTQNNSSPTAAKKNKYDSSSPEATLFTHASQQSCCIGMIPQWCWNQKLMRLMQAHTKYRVLMLAIEKQQLFYVNKKTYGSMQSVSPIFDMFRSWRSGFWVVGSKGPA